MKLFSKNITPPDDPVSSLIDKAAADNPFSVPENYFENFQQEMSEKIKDIPHAPKINIYKWAAVFFIAAVLSYLGYNLSSNTKTDASSDSVYSNELVINDSGEDFFIEVNNEKNIVYIYVRPDMTGDELDEVLMLFGADNIARENARARYLALNSINYTDITEDSTEENETEDTHNNTYTYYKSMNQSGGTYAEVFEMVSTEGSLLSWPKDICVERPILLNAHLGDNYDYSWSDGSTGESIRVKETGIYTVTAIHKDNPSEIVSRSILVRYIPVPVLNNEYYFNACVGETVQINVKQGIDAYRFNWPDLNTTSANANITQPGKYKVEIQGCRTYLDSFIVIYQHCDLSIPAIISPNNDGFNDVFMVDNLSEYPETTIEIYDGQQKLVYQSDDYQNDWAAEGLPDGAYYYLLKFSDGISQEGIVNVRRK